jgi:hypothetical protein
VKRTKWEGKKSIGKKKKKGKGPGGKFFFESFERKVAALAALSDQNPSKPCWINTFHVIRNRAFTKTNPPSRLGTQPGPWPAKSHVEEDSASCFP